MKNLLILLFTLFFSSSIHSQIGLAYGYSSTGVGVGKIFPAFNSDVKVNGWNNFLLRNGIFELSFAQGEFTFGKSGETGFIADKGSLFNIGVVIPIHHITLLQRKKYWSGIHMTPLMSVHYSTQSMGEINGVNVGQWGINLAPGLSFQFPLGMIDLKLNNGIYFGKEDARNSISRYRNATFLFSPSITLQLDGMFERLGGQIVKSGEYQTTWRVLESEEVEYDDSNTNFRLKTTRRNYSYRSSSGTSTRKIQKAFWYLSGFYNIGRKDLLVGYNEKEKMERLIPEGNGFGGSFGGRYRDFMIDVGLERNEGFYALRNPELIEELQNVVSNYPLVEGEFSAMEVRGKIGFDVISAIGHIVAKRQVKKLKSIGWPWVKFMRWNVGLSGGYSIPGQTKLLTSNGDQILDDFFTTHPEIERNAQTSILENKSAWTIGLFMNWEMGPISIGWDWHGHNDFGWRTGIGLRYMLPLNQLKNL